ncbi:MAG: zinc-dependent peptidase, partial [Candidatus Competibacterales bacterium]|nr:zinc-dependent peptidase [Candidatus Competibacterales bacterium]
MWNVRDWRRRRILQRARLPDSLWRQTVAELPLLRGLDAEELARLRELVILFRHQKVFVPRGGLELDDTMELTVSAQACLPVLNLGLDWYDGWRSVILYPESFIAPHEEVDEAG